MKKKKFFVEYFTAMQKTICYTRYIETKKLNYKPLQTKGELIWQL
jgi:hypothetical protein